MTETEEDIERKMAPLRAAQAAAQAAEMTADEMFDALTGFEEIAVAQMFKRTVGALATEDPLQLSRALVFAHLKRCGLRDVDAYRQAQEMGTAAVRDYFAAPVEENPAAPVTESGKGESPSA
jgi:hypothetical protein